MNAYLTLITFIFSSNMNFLYLIGGLLVLHAGYSSYEHHQILKHASGIARDIIGELFVGLIIINFGAFQSIANSSRYGLTHDKIVTSLKPFLRPIEMSEAMQSVNLLGITEFEEYDSRIDFLDVVEKRRQHREWAK